MATESLYAGANFSITPAQSFPVQNTATGVLPVYYTVTNLTGSARTNYGVVGLPSNVVQVTDVNHCSIPINLASGASCSLQLNVTGTVDSAGFALCNGGSCTTASEPMSVTLLTQSLQVAVGQDTFSNPTRPIIFQSQNTGTSWSKVELSPYAFQGAAQFRSAACQGLVCVAVGEDNIINLIAQTQNGGDSWSYVTGLPYGGLYAVSASTANTFVAVGYNHSGVGGGVLISTDKGQTWAEPTTLPTIAGHLNSVGCSGDLCVATSTTFDVLKSTDGGHNWSLIRNLDFGGVHVTTGSLFGASCSGSTCIVVGEDATDPNAPVPLIGQTTNGGTTWTWIEPLTNNGKFYGAQCNSSGCTAVGQAYSLDGSILAPEIAQYTNGSWTYSTPPLNNDIAAGYTFRSVSCNGTSCVAVGDNGTSGIISQFTLGTTWDRSYIIGPTSTSSLAGATYATVTCDSAMCFAAGQSHTGSTLPFIAQSINNGTWEDAGITGVTTGTLTGSAAGN